MKEEVLKEYGDYKVVMTDTETYDAVTAQPGEIYIEIRNKIGKPVGETIVMSRTLHDYLKKYDKTKVLEEFADFLYNKYVKK